MSAFKPLVLAFAVATIGSVSVARAAPPTVQPSPGYDRALAESRRARTEPVIEVPAPPVVPRQRAKRHRH